MVRVRSVLIALLIVLLGAVGCVVVEREGPGFTGTDTGAPPDPAPEGGDTAPAEQRMERAIFDRVNAEREERGLQPVEWNEELAAVARDWSAEMARTGRLEHQDVREVLRRDNLSGFTSVGENIFRSTGPVPAGAIHAGWMRSDGHRLNVVNPGWNRLGVGVLCGEDGSVWATQEFGRTADADRPPVSKQIPPPQPIARPEHDGPTCR